MPFCWFCQVVAHFIIFSGDIIIEVNGTTVTSSDIVKPYLNTNGRHVALGYIPSGKHSSKRDKSLSSRKVPFEGSRVKRARTLHDRVSAFYYRLVISLVAKVIERVKVTWA